MRLQYMIEILQIAQQHFHYWYIIPIMILFTNYIVKRKKGKIVGFAIFGKRHLHFFAIDKAHIAKGLGSIMFRFLKKRILALNVDPENTKAIKFYKRHGFVIQKEVLSLVGRRLKMVRGACRGSPANSFISGA